MDTSTTASSMPALLTQTTSLGGVGISGRRFRKGNTIVRNDRNTSWKTLKVRSSASADPLLLRVARGEQCERPPVWLMRQAGRYMAEFREYSDKYGFRHRSETADIAIELSLQPWRAFKPDGVIMFSDILTPLPALGVEFDVVKVKRRPFLIFLPSILFFSFFFSHISTFENILRQGQRSTYL